MIVKKVLNVVRSGGISEYKWVIIKIIEGLRSMSNGDPLQA